jgi:hypothetical protein
MITMENPKKKNELAIKQFLIYVMSNKKVHITDIITQIRAIKGVVTISIFESSKKITADRDFTKLKLKFLQYSENTEENIKELKKDILLIPGIYNIILKIKKTDLEVKGGSAQPAATRGTGGSSVVKTTKSNEKEDSNDGINTKE